MQFKQLLVKLNLLLVILPHVFLVKVVYGLLINLPIVPKLVLIIVLSVKVLLMQITTMLMLLQFVILVLLLPLPV